MPITGDAKKVFKSMKKTYGSEEEAKKVFYATANKQKRKPETWKKAAVRPNAALTVMDAAPRGDEVHQPLTVNPYDGPEFDPQNAVDYENGYQYAQSFGHLELNQADADQVERWAHAPIPWREGFAEAARRLGVGRLADMIEGEMKESNLVTWDYMKTAGVGSELKRQAVRFAPALGAAAGYGIGHELGDAASDAYFANEGIDLEGLQRSGSPTQQFSAHYIDNAGAVLGGVAGGTAGTVAGASVPEYTRAQKMKLRPLPDTLKVSGALKTIGGGLVGAAAPIAAGGLLGYELGGLVQAPEIGAAGGALAGSAYAPYTGLAGAAAGALHDSTKERDELRKNRNRLVRGMPVKTAISSNTMNRTVSGAIGGALLPIALGAGAGAGFGELVDIDTPEHESPGAAVGGVAGGALAAPLAPAGATVGAALGAHGGLKRDAKIDKENRRWARMYPTEA